MVFRAWLLPSIEIAQCLIGAADGANQEEQDQDRNFHVVLQIAQQRRCRRTRC